MIKHILFVLILSLFTVVGASAQEIVWHNPENSQINPIEGQYWHGESRSSFYNRMPERFKPDVREAVWKLSQHCAGESIRFRTNSSKIVVKYCTINSAYSMPHMPSTGVSGVDLYRYNANEQMERIVGSYKFDDTVSYNYSSINSKNMPDNSGYIYQLYLPLYNGVTTLEIGVVEGASFEFVEPRKEKPIVLYGTSIAQGACASRPAMAWSTIVSRMLDMPLYNFGFSGNGRLEDALIDMICEIDASIFILDCIPNIDNRESEEITELVCNAVRKIRSKYSQTPIILSDHLGYSDISVVETQLEKVEKCLKAQEKAIQILKKEGVIDIYHLDFEALSIPPESSVDYAHPSDYGMMLHAEAYQRCIKEILGL